MTDLLYGYFTGYDFFTLTKPMLLLWLFMLIVPVGISLIVATYWFILDLYAGRYYYGKSPDDVLVQKFAIIVSMHGEMCRIVIMHFCIMAVIAVATFFLANVYFRVALICQIVQVLLNLCICLLRLNGEYAFVQSVKN